MEPIKVETLVALWEQSKGSTPAEKIVDFARQVETLTMAATMLHVSRQSVNKEHETVHDLASVLGPMVDDYVDDKPEGFTLRFVAARAPDGGIGFGGISLHRDADMIQHTGNRASRRAAVRRNRSR